jgi:hypothetical protein
MGLVVFARVRPLRYLLFNILIFCIMNILRFLFIVLRNGKSARSLIMERYNLENNLLINFKKENGRLDVYIHLPDEGSDILLVSQLVGYFTFNGSFVEI